MTGTGAAPSGAGSGSVGTHSGTAGSQVDGSGMQTGGDAGSGAMGSAIGANSGAAPSAVDASTPATDSPSTLEAGSLNPIDLSSSTIYSVFPDIYSQAGNFAAVTADLPRIHDLGFDVLYLLPVTPLGQPTGSHPAFGSPYCVHDYYAINAAYGTTDDLVTLVQSAHALGLHVILDEVLNHTSWDNALITQHPEYYVHSDGNPQNVSSIEDAFTFSDVAQLDYKTPGNGLATYMVEMLAYWLKTYDVDGFRFDTADDPATSGRMIPATFWQTLRPQLEAVKAGILMLGEEEDPVLADAPFELDYGWQLQGLYGAGGLQQVATGASAALLEQAWQGQQMAYPTAMRHMTLLQDWDLDEDLNLYGGVPNTMAAAAFNFTIDGVPLLFNGEEVGNDKSGVNTHAIVDWNGPNATTFTPFYKSLLSLRKSNSTLQHGSVGWIDNTAGPHVVSYVRSDATATFLVAINFSGAAVTGTLSAPSSPGWADVSPTGSPGGTAHMLPPALSLRAYDFAIFRSQN
jgi:cyclomaltodextrinase